MKKFFVKSLNSCYQRQQNVDKYRRLLCNIGYAESETEEKADIIYVWTCAFRQDAEDNSVRTIQSLREKYPEKKIYICGCMTTIDPLVTEELSRTTDAEVIPWKTEEQYFEKELLDASDTVCGVESIANDIEKYKRENPNQAVSFADQFIKLCIAEGCNCDCAYCSEKLAFPPYRSFPIDRLVERCKELVEKTHTYRVILVADSPGEYGCDCGTDITELMEKLYALNEKVEIVLNNFHPRFFLKFMPYFSAKIKEGKIYHINLPIQSASTAVLDRMRRGYTKADLERICSMFEELSFSRFDTHILVGFDGESYSDFVETVDFLSQHRFRYILASKYMYAAAGHRGEHRTGIVSEEEKQVRIAYLKKQVKSYGAILNYDGSELSTIGGTD